MRYFIVILLALAAGCCHIPKQEVPTWSYVEVFTEAGTGSGFVVKTTDEGAFVVTAAHVCVMPGKKMIMDYHGHKYLPEFVAVSPGWDLCLLHVSGLDIKPMRLANEPLAIGDTAFAIGSPAGFWVPEDRFVPVVRGNYSGELTRLGQKRSVYSLPVSGGMSGGAIVNEDGEVVGVITGLWKFGHYDQLSAAIPLRFVKLFLKKALP